MTPVAVVATFAWLPIRLDDGRLVWLRKVYRCVTRQTEWFSLTIPAGAL
jgi:hypothetical protein